MGKLISAFFIYLNNRHIIYFLFFQFKLDRIDVMHVKNIGGGNSH